MNTATEIMMQSAEESRAEYRLRAIAMAAANRAVAEERDSGREIDEDNFIHVLMDVAQHAAAHAIKLERETFANEIAELDAHRRQIIEAMNLERPRFFIGTKKAVANIGENKPNSRGDAPK